MRAQTSFEVELNPALFRVPFFKKVEVLMPTTTPSVSHRETFQSLGHREKLWGYHGWQRWHSARTVAASGSSIHGHVEIYAKGQWEERIGYEGLSTIFLCL